ncbi:MULTISPECIES: hypothetical protein [Halorussus]|uniref:hypothetical protein n=1 Tax=Halorussus TaxID=1070314 RepID=UPI0020A137FD|nr:hypothetical protein [Halorussus vallis]USZ76762.1 hypothetical protein NGM07_05405 [Halorussus vallis]
MAFLGTERRLALEDLTGRLFLVAGGTAIALEVGDSVGAFALVPVPDALVALPLIWMVESLPVLVSLPLAVASVLVLYPVLVDRTSTVATGSLLLAGGPWAVFVAVIAWGLASVVLPAVPFSPDALLSAHVAGLALWLAFFLGIGLVGVSLLRTNRYRLAGGGFLTFILAWNGPFLLAKATSYPPDGLLRFSSVGTALAMVVIGYSLSLGQDFSERSARDRGP